MLKLDLGAGNTKHAGFTSVDLYDPEADICADICHLPFDYDSVDQIVCYQVVEHVPYWQSQSVFEEMYRVLKPGATAIVETVDFDYVARAILKDGLEEKWIWNVYGQYYRPWDKDRYPDWENNAASIHRNAWNERRIREICEPLGFEVVLQTMDEKHPNYKYEENLSVRLTKTVARLQG